MDRGVCMHYNMIRAKIEKTILALIIRNGLIAMIFNFFLIFIIRISRATAEFHYIGIIQSATEVFGVLFDNLFYRLYVE